ncbi:MAG: rhodanese-like domain-containing protein [Armatimonadota bacterium]
MPNTLTREQLKAMIDAKERFTLVDVRFAESYEAEHLPGAINMPVNEIEALAPGRIALDEPIVVYCATFECTASPTAAMALEDLGFTNVADFEGGLADWQDAGYPTASGKVKV